MPELIDDFFAKDFVLSVNGKNQRIISADRETRPLSIVVVVVTSPSNRCFDDLGYFLHDMGLAFWKVLGKDDDVAVVLTDSQGTVERPFLKERHTLPDDLARSQKNSRANFSKGTVDEWATETSDAGPVFPIPALRSASRLLAERPENNDRLILFVNQLENTNVGQASESRQLLNELIDRNIAVSWLGSNSKERDFRLEKVPYGKREYFLGLTSITGGHFQVCRQKSDMFSVLFGSDDKSGQTPEAELKMLLDRTRARYRLKYQPTEQSKNQLPATVGLSKEAANRNVHLDYPKAVNYE
ncbi:MAG: hypothetical protein H7070_16360 [Saprospiraceae bacterium]|nr:hypothetical protein [Pyrinomonadaceae bacterium]